MLVERMFSLYLVSGFWIKYFLDKNDFILSCMVLYCSSMVQLLYWMQFD